MQGGTQPPFLGESSPGQDNEGAVTDLLIPHVWYHRCSSPVAYTGGLTARSEKAGSRYAERLREKGKGCGLFVMSCCRLQVYLRASVVVAM